MPHVGLSLIPVGQNGTRGARQGRSRYGGDSSESRPPASRTKENTSEGDRSVWNRVRQAEPLYRRSLAIWEEALGPEHPNVATSLENYAALLRATGHTAEADKMEARAKAIRARLAKTNK